MDLALDYLQHIHEVELYFEGVSNHDPMELIIKSAAVLGLPPQAVNPLLARTFAANLRVRDRKNLLSDF